MDQYVFRVCSDPEYFRVSRHNGSFAMIDHLIKHAANSVIEAQGRERPVDSLPQFVSDFRVAQSPRTWCIPKHRPRRVSFQQPSVVAQSSVKLDGLI